MGLHSLLAELQLSRSLTYVIPSVCLVPLSKVQLTCLVTTSHSTLPHSTLSKRHNALSYHRVREAIAAGFIRFHYIDGTDNPADILTKALGFQQFWPLIKPLLFWRGDTATSLPGKGE